MYTAVNEYKESILKPGIFKINVKDIKDVHALWIEGVSQHFTPLDDYKQDYQMSMMYLYDILDKMDIYCSIICNKDAGCIQTCEKSKTLVLRFMSIYQNSKNIDINSVLFRKIMKMIKLRVIDHKTLTEGGFNTVELKALIPAFNGTIMGWNQDKKKIKSFSFYNNGSNSRRCLRPREKA